MKHQAIHEPFYYTRGSKIGVLFIHGIFGSPNQFRPLANRLYNAGCDCKAILLPGHGNNCKTFTTTNYKEWKKYAKSEIIYMKQKYEKVFVVGHSMGSLFSLDFADELGVNGVILLNLPIKIMIRPEQIKYCATIVLGNKKKYNQGKTRRNLLFSIEKGFWYEYILWVFPLLGVLHHMLSTRLKLATIKVPVLLFQSKKDEVVHYKSIFRFKKIMKNDNLKLVMLKDAKHSYYPPHEEAIIERLVLKFIKKYK
ncbi:MAG: hypothetical protein ATN36_02310 [Epulopiscium sp. Nele67-Bin005]|nr:MAG: hypothetical protein ATN36_02310 [Epulopiscium sp. Nele67-Bin005]